MSKRNIVWLVAVLAVGVVVTLAAGWLWGLLAAVVVLVLSEVVERTLRRRRRAAAGITEAPSVRDAIGSRRKRR